MSDLQVNIKRINDKLQKLLKQYQQLKKDNERQSILINQLTKDKEWHTSTITALQQQVGILKASTGQMNLSDKKTFEKNINQYIKEIDKCIELLSE